MMSDDIKKREKRIVKFWKMLLLSILPNLSFMMDRMTRAHQNLINCSKFHPLIGSNTGWKVGGGERENLAPITKAFLKISIVLQKSMAIFYC